MYQTVCLPFDYRDRATRTLSTLVLRVCCHTGAAAADCHDDHHDDDPINPGSLAQVAIDCPGPFLTQLQPTVTVAASPQSRTASLRLIDSTAAVHAPLPTIQRDHQVLLNSPTFPRLLGPRPALWAFRLGAGRDPAL